MNSEAQVSVHLKNGLEKRNLIIIEKSSYPFPQAKKNKKKKTQHTFCVHLNGYLIDVTLFGLAVIVQAPEVV